MAANAGETVYFCIFVVGPRCRSQKSVSMRGILGLSFTLILAMTFTSCNRKATETENQLLVETWDTPFGVPPFDRISTGDFAPALEQGMSLHNEQIDAIVTSKERPTFDNVIAAYDNSGRILSRAWTIFGMLNAADTNEEMQAVAARMSPLMTAHYDAIMMNDALFAKVREVYDGRMSAGLTAEQLRLTEKTYDGFVRAGALLSAEQKQRLKQINSRLSELSVTFAENLLAENNAYTLEVAVDSLVGLPPTVRDAALDAGEAHGRKGRYIFTLDKPSMIPFLTYAKNRALRREIYEAYLTRCNHDDEHDNKAVVSEMARLRSEKARLLGYDSYAAYVTADEMAGTPEAVYAVLDEIWTPALERARAEVERMEPLLRRDEGSEATLEPWDWWYYAEKVREAEYDISESKVRLPVAGQRQGRYLLPCQPRVRDYVPTRYGPPLQRGVRGIRGARYGRDDARHPLFRLPPACGQAGGCVVRHLHRALVRRRGAASGPCRERRMQLHAAVGTHAGAVVAGRDADALPRVRACAALPLLGGALSRPVGGRG